MSTTHWLAGASKSERRSLLKDLATQVLRQDRDIARPMEPLAKRKVAHAKQRGLRYVYVIEAEGGDVKVGVASDPQRRLRELQTGSGSKLRVAFKVLCRAGAERHVEARCHEELSKFRKIGEWFDVELGAAISVVRRVAEDLGRASDHARRY
jgi:predicted GIY-YIG superfamily endonuclease